MDDLHIDSRLLNFKTAIDDAVASVPDMTAEEKLRAVQWWNVASEKLQKIVNDSAADIHALADRYEEEDLNNKANDLVKTMESKIFEDVDSSLANKANLSAQTNEEPLDFPDIPTPNLADPELETSPATLTDSNVVAGQTLSMTNLTNSDINVPQTSPHLSSNIDSTHSNSQSLNETDANESLSLNENHEEVDGYQLADQLSIMENESLNFSTDDVTASISDLADISTENNVLYDIDQANRPNVIESAPKEQHNHQTLESSIQDSNSSLADNLGVESDHSFMSESGDSDLNIDRFDVSHVPLEIDTETNSLETLIASQTDANQSLISASIEKSVDPTTIPSIEDNTTKEDTDDKQYTCDVCGKISTNLSTHTSHKWTHTKSYVCDDCGAKFSTKGNLLVHQRRHTGEKPFACDKCPAIFSTKGNLRRHIKAHSGERSWACEICDSKFTEKKSLKVHMRRHTGERPYKCTVCNKAFSQTGVLQTHMALHLDERKYLCEMCGKAFRQRSQLRLHVLRHEGVKKWDCSNCAAKFLTKGDLERHFRIHTGERPYVCPLCGKTFTRQQSLNEHSNRHYGLKPYSCDICNKKFSEMSACYKHIKVHKKQQQKSEPDNPDLDNQVSHFPSLSSSNDDLVSSQPIIN